MTPYELEGHLQKVWYKNARLNGLYNKDSKFFYYKTLAEFWADATRDEKERKSGGTGIMSELNTGLDVLRKDVYFLELTKSQHILHKIYITICYATYIGI